MSGGGTSGAQEALVDEHEQPIIDGFVEGFVDGFVDAALVRASRGARGAAELGPGTPRRGRVEHGGEARVVSARFLFASR